jgi:hypothetical protein
MSKHDKTKIEKRERNKIYSDRFVKEEKEKEQKKSRKDTSVWGKWCRTKGHPADCECIYQ